MAKSASLSRFALAMVATAALAACSSSASPSAAAPTAAAPSAAAPSAAPASAATGTKSYKDMVVGFIQTGSESGWRAANTASFKETATQKGITLKFYDAQNKLENQVSAFHQFNQ